MSQVRQEPAAAQSFADKIICYSERVVDCLDRALPAAGQQPERLHEAMRYAVLSVGKRIRPILVYITGECLDVAPGKLDAPAAAIELIHAFSLVHDDLPSMDDDDLRRGLPTVHRKFDEATAILAADALQPLAFQVIVGARALTDSEKTRIVSILTEACGSTGMTGGQSIDLRSEGQTLSTMEMEQLHELKTGALIRASVMTACSLAPDLSGEKRAALDRFARDIGLAFQIRDDILDVEGRTGVIGKNAGADQAVAIRDRRGTSAVRRTSAIGQRAIVAVRQRRRTAQLTCHLYRRARALNDSRKILHVDMDAFYAAVEQRDDPSLRGKPLVVGGSNNRGVVAAASYEVRKFGVRSAMPMRDAYRRCPSLIRVTPRMSHYQSVSKEIFAIFREFTPYVEGLSLDEAFLDVTASLLLFGDARSIAVEIKRRIHAQTELTASVGVAPNKLVAKIASDLDKPDGLFVVDHSNMREVLDPLPVRVIPGIGPETLVKLSRVGIATIADLRLAPDRDLEPVFGRFTQRTRDRAAGIDDRPVNASRPDKSISTEETFGTDLSTVTEMNRQLLRLCERTAGRLRAKELVAGTVQVKIRQADFSTFTRQRSLRPPGNGTDQLYETARNLLHDWLAENPGARLRLLGVGGSDLAKDAQPDLFAPAADGPGTPLDQAVDAESDDSRNQ